MTDLNAIKRIGLSVLVAGVAAGVSAVWNMILEFVYKKIDEAMPTSEEIEKELKEGFENGEN